MKPERRGPEYRDVQRPALEMLRDHFGYLAATGEELDAERASRGEVLLVGRLEKAIRAINPGITDDGLRQAVDALRLPGGAALGLMEANEAAHALLSRWAIVEEMKGSGRSAKEVGRSVRYIDFDNPEANEFLVVEEYTVKGPREDRRLDLVLFINGIPIVAVECKRPDDPHGLEQAIDDLLTYQDRVKGVPRLFHTVQVCVALRKAAALYGTVLTPKNRYAEWKSVYPITLDQLKTRLGRVPTPQDVTLAGLCAKANLLDMVRTFSAFDKQGGRVVKKLARYQQFEAVNEAMARIVDPHSKAPQNERGGVIWHTQGSGKSLTMLWLALKLRRSKGLDSPTMLIVTDRKDLDRQITETFQNCGFENPVRADRVAHMRRLLATPGQTVMTTVQKFRDETDLEKGGRHPVLSMAENVFVLVDEAHRTEYGYFNANLRKGLPNACFVAFTGTPIARTVKHFGGYIHKYTMPQSVADGATVPILYESRLADLAVWGNSLNPMFEAQFPHLNEEQKRKIRDQEITARRIGEASDRIEKIAFDIVQHYRANFEPDGFKAQVAVCSQLAAKRYYDEFRKYPEIADRVAVLISDPSEKGSDLRELTDQFADEEEIIRQFVHEDADTLAIIVVVDKYLTGFDAPVERVLYLDRPLKEHNLLQAIARVNRPMPEKDKTWGLIVDYWGVAKFLPEALAVFDEDLSTEQVLTKRDADAAFQDLKARRAEVFECFPEGLPKKDVVPWVLALEPEDARTTFLQTYRAFYKALEQVLPDERALAFLGDFAWLQRVRREAATMYSAEDLDVADASEKVRVLIDKHVKGVDVRVLLQPVPILSADFKEEIEKLASPRAKAARMEHAMERAVTVKLAEDPVFFESIRDRLERIIAERRQERMDDVQEYQLLLKLRSEVTDHEAQTTASNRVSERASPFFRIIDKELTGVSGRPDEEHLSALAETVVSELDALAVVDWTHKEDVQREMRRQVKRELRMRGIPDDRLDAIASALLDLARVRLAQ
ncbi:MAG: type I restriction endonuclease subunit R [Phycisphaeraceae bacterium]|nr:MAG: type I restriction endonuclease subunit R [Phycisphaeraceae bacterium]